MTTPARAIVELSDVRLRFEQKEVLRGVDLTVASKERLVVLGQSGSGKSTLLRLILGIFPPTSGSIRFRGREITRMGRGQLDLLRTKIGMVYQYSALISSMTVACLNHCSAPRRAGASPTSRWPAPPAWLRCAA